MIEEVKKSVYENAKERISSPILGSFAIFFLGYHWKVWVLLFWSDEKGMSKIEELRAVWPNSKDDFVIPAIVSLVFVFGYPFLKLTYELFIKTVDLIQIRYEMYITRIRMSLEELSQQRERERKLWHAEKRFHSGKYEGNDKRYSRW